MHAWMTRVCAARMCSRKRFLFTWLVSLRVCIHTQVVGPAIGVSTVLAAMLGLCVLLCTGVLSWRDCLTYTPAWDTLMWFAGGYTHMQTHISRHTSRVSPDPKPLTTHGHMLCLYWAWMPMSSHGPQPAGPMLHTMI